MLCEGHLTSILYSITVCAPHPGLHGSVLVTNEHSVSAHFQWHAREGVETDTFFVMYPTGVCVCVCVWESSSTVAR